MPFIGNKPSAVPLTSADIADSIITSAKIVDATITNSDVASSIITGQTAETSIAGGDSVLIYDDSASALRKMTRTNFVAGIGGTNTPAFEATKSSYQTVTDETVTKLEANTETFDTDGCYDNTTNYRFTPTTAGKYFVYLQAFPEALALNCLFNPVLRIRKNGSTDIAMSFVSNNSSFSSTQPITVNAIINMNGSTDYLEPFGYVDVTVGNTPIISGIRFGAYKLIGA